MSGYNNQPDDFEFDENGSNSGGGLRKQLEAALAREKQYLEELEKRQGSDRQKTVTDLLTGKSLDPALAEIVPQDADPAEWIEKYGHLLGAKQGQSLEDGKQAELELDKANDDDPALVAEREALEKMRQVQEEGSPAAITTDALERMEKITDEGEFLKFIQSNGAV